MENSKQTLLNRLVTEAQTLEEYETLAKFFAKSKILPKHITSLQPTDIMMILDHGMAMGFTWFEALSSLIPKDNGHFVIRGDAAKALVMSKVKVRLEEKYEGTIEDNTLKCTITCYMENSLSYSASFGLQDAIRAGLYVPDSPVKSFYKTYPKRTIKYRALGFLLRDVFPGILKNLWTEEEYQDFRGVGETETSGDGKVFVFPNAEAKQKTTKAAEAALLAKQNAAQIYELTATDNTTVEVEQAPSEPEVEKTFSKQENDFDNEKPEEPESTEEDRLMWFYYPDTDTLLTGLESEADTERLADCTMIGEATKPSDISEGKALRDAYNPESGEEPLGEQEAELVWSKELEKELSDMKSAPLVEWIDKNLTTEIYEAIDLLPQRRTTKALVPIIKAYMDNGTESAMLYMKKTYPGVFNTASAENTEEKQVVETKTEPTEAEPAKTEPAKAEPQPKAEPQKPKEKPVEEENTSEGNLLGLVVAPLQSGSRDIDHVMEHVYMKLLNIENSKYFNFIKNECGGDDEMEDFLTLQPLDVVNALINRAVKEAK